MIAAAVLIGVAANADNLSVGIAYAMQRRRIRRLQNLLVAFATTTVTLAALWAGEAARYFFPPAAPNGIGGGILILLAIAGLLRPARREADPGYVGAVGWAEAAMLSASLSINNIGLAFAGGLADVPRVLALASVFCFSIALLSAGQWIGTRAGGRLRGQLRQAWIGNLVLLAAGVMVWLGV